MARGVYTSLAPVFGLNSTAWLSDCYARSTFVAWYGDSMWWRASLQMHFICYRINNNYLPRPPIGAKSKAGLDMVQLHQKGKTLDVMGFSVYMRLGTENSTVIQIFYTDDHRLVCLCGRRNRLQKRKTTSSTNTRHKLMVAHASQSCRCVWLTMRSRPVVLRV